jgi:cation diffusion facilitator CzcD-associated flavoprotein CzcO
VAACDVASNLYAFSFEQPAWSRRYSGQPEILDYLEGLVARYRLGPHLRLGAEVTAATFDEGDGCWTLSVADGSSIRARVVVSAVGQLSRPSYPAIAGRERFAGRSWHSARWDHAVDLTGLTVGSIGTGASALQFVPEVAKVAARVHVFQRSAPYVLPKADGPYEGRDAALEQLALFRRADRLRRFLQGELLTLGYVHPRLGRPVVKAWRAYLEREIPDPALRARCQPDYALGCKRIGFTSDWYATLRQDHVELVTEPITEITGSGVVTADGTERPLDVLLYGTGFAASEFLVPMTVTGRQGAVLHERWSAGAEAYLGTVVPGFPNFFLLYGPNTNLGANSILYMLEAQIGYVLSALEARRRDRLAWLDVRPEVHRSWVDQVARTSATTAYQSGCHSWYTNEAGRNTNNWPTLTYRYRRALRHLRLADFETAPAADAGAPAPPLSGRGLGG